MSISDHPILSVNQLSVGFIRNQQPYLAIDDVSFAIHAGQTLGLVGESGCGKSLTAMSILGLLPNTASILNGQILFNQHNLLQLSHQQLQQYRGAQIALIPQDPMTALNPVYTIGDQLAEVMITHLGMGVERAWAQAAELLDWVRIPKAKDRLKDYPHQFSGGMKQRVLIAMALSCQPKLLIADEPTTALDVTVQAQILALLKSIQQETKTAILLITHDLGVVAETCHQVAVMYAGQIAEQAPVHTLFENPQHPYTQGLIAALPSGQGQRLKAISGQPPGIRLKQAHCVFEPRCEQRFEDCKTTAPPLLATEAQHLCRCLLYQGAKTPSV